MNIRQATDRDQKRTAERHPDMVREIASQGHDIGCHSYMHKKVYELTPEEFRADTNKAKNILEELVGKKIVIPQLKAIKL